MLSRALLRRPVLDVAVRLLGAVIAHDDVAIRLTEVEAYAGLDDPASHGFRGRTARNEVMFGPPGYAYVYFTYGMHFCMNVVTGRRGAASAVLLRAGEVVEGLAVARSRRPGAPDRDLARGPARLTLALGVDRGMNGVDLLDPVSALRLLRGSPVDPARVRWGPRVGIRTAADWPWRAWIDGEPTVSPYRPHAPKRRAR